LLVLNRMRNELVHGNSKDLPPKAKIDWLVEITQRLISGLATSQVGGQ
jgi:hypothetical protein